MTDRELLELAAKALGGRYMPHVRGILINGSVLTWSPLQYDGDALRLAVKMRISISLGKDVVEAHIGQEDGSLEVSKSDLSAATRRAITRAAAEIGKAMP